MLHTARRVTPFEEMPMTEREELTKLIVPLLAAVAGIVEVVPVEDNDRAAILEIEREAEKKSLMGLGKVVNVGVMEVLDCDFVYAALTDMTFDWAVQPNLLLKKGDEIVGQEVTDEQTIERLAADANAWFMHKNFVVFKNKISFPKDVMEKICHFEIPTHTADWCISGKEDIECQLIIYGSPSTPCDVFLKDRYFLRKSDKGLGTILVGIKL
jgi:hypothetical protein